MRFGAVFPHADFGNDRGAIRDFAQGVEALGFDHLITYDHVLSAEHVDRSPPLTGPYDETHEFHEPFVLFGYLGAVTDTIDLVVGVLVAPQRQTALIAKQAAEVQALSGGRLRLGLGTGWNWVEYESLGADFERRGAVLDEQVAVLRQLWQQRLVSFDGDFHRIDRATIRPLPDVRIPLWFGGYSTRALRRSARHGDGHLFGHLRASDLLAATSLRALLAEGNRSAGPDFGIDAVTNTDAGADVAGMCEIATAWEAAGGTHLSVRTFELAPGRSNTRSVTEHLTLFERWRDALQSCGVWRA